MVKGLEFLLCVSEDGGKRVGCCQKHKNYNFFIFMLLMIKKGTFFLQKMHFFFLTFHCGCHGDLSWCLTPAQRPPAHCYSPVRFQAWLTLLAPLQEPWGPVCKMWAASYFRQNNKREFKHSFCFYFLNNFRNGTWRNINTHTYTHKYKTVQIK